MTRILVLPITCKTLERVVKWTFLIGMPTWLTLGLIYMEPISVGIGGSMTFVCWGFQIAIWKSDDKWDIKCKCEDKK